MIFILLTLFEWYRWLTNVQPHPWLLTLVTVPILVYIVRIGSKHRKELADHRLALEELRAHGYKVFHDIPGTHFNIDHVIAGPTGIYTIETKTLSRPARGNPKIIYDGNKLWRDDGWGMDEHLVQGHAQASWLADLLNQGRTTKYTVQPVVLFPGWWVESIASKVNRDVWVLNSRHFHTG